MKKLFILLAISISSFAFASASPVNYRVLESFKYDFAQASDVKWSPLDNAGLFQATFTYNKEELIAVYNEEGELLGTARYINKQSLPIMVAKQLNATYPDYLVRTVIERASAGETTYFITLDNGKSSLVIESKSSGYLSVFKKIRKPFVVNE